MNKIRLLICLTLTMSVVIAASAAETKSDANTNYIFSTEFVTADDGIKLATDIYLPKSAGKFPALLVRTPYDKKHSGGAAKWFADNGIAFIVQDCRGKYASEGKFYAWRDERKDGLATLKWIRSRPWSSGKVSGYGGSYLGYVQWSISDKLDVITPSVTAADQYDKVYPFGLFSLDTTFRWGMGVSDKTNAFLSPEQTYRSGMVLPLSNADQVIVKKDIDYINDILSHSTHDKYWQSMNYRGIAKCPVLSIGGWYDISLLPQINDFQALGKKAHPDSRLVIGPWGHGPLGVKNDYGGIEKTGNRDDLEKHFILKYLTGKDTPSMIPPFKDARYNLFIMERNEYYASDLWPPKATKFTDFYLTPAGISTSKSDDSGLRQYTYDPNNPYPNIGGTILGDNVGANLQNPNASRPDQAIFESPLLDKPLTLLGPLSARLFVSSDAPCTDFMVLLQDVFPDGRIINIQEGGAAVRFKNSDEIIEAKVPVWSTGYQLNPGHKLRVAITSSWFPRFARSLNTCAPIFSADQVRIAHQKIHFGRNHPSALILPVLPASP